jgi:hypothetical protein
MTIIITANVALYRRPSGQNPDRKLCPGIPVVATVRVRCSAVLLIGEEYE